ncbi:MAG: leukotoxin LktA family filamentous adhesin, partial [Acidaminococcaceae bacterium]|nr:leukotoxin LktA family filamentous adhesin [Acidaminococcaceae bacterium]
MNKIYKIIWSDVRKCYVVVAEIAKNRGKNNVRTIMEGLSAHALMRAGRWALPFVAAGLLLQPVTGWATEIRPASVLPDNQKNTVVNNNGVYDVYTQRVISGKLGVNQFDKFTLSGGNIANMHFQTKGGALKADSLVNLVQARIDVQGTVNAIKDGRIDGNLFFISPNGMTLGSTGVINAGRFAAFAPTQSYFDDLWSTSFENNAAGNHDNYVSDAVKGDFAKFGTRYKKDEQEGKDEGEFKSTNLEFNAEGADSKGIEIKGKINTRSGIVLGAGNIAIENGGLLKSQSDIDFSSLVNTENVSGADFSNIGMTAVAADKSGDIILRTEAKHDFSNSPLIPGAETYDSITNVHNDAAVTVKGEISGDGGVDISAASATTFNNKNWPGISGLQDVLPELLNDLGITGAVDWAHNVNTASVTLDNTGKVTAG